MMLTLAVSGYRSLRDVVLPLERLTVITGPNGSGKSSLYRSIRLLAAVAEGRVVSALAHEGGLSSTLWAGPEQVAAAVRRGERPTEGTLRKGRVSLKLGLCAEDFGYAIDLGLPSSHSGRARDEPSKFGRDPEVKAEAGWAGPVLRRANTLAARKGGAVTVLRGREQSVLRIDLPPFDSMMSHTASAQDTPELIELRERMRAWRFYDQLRTDSDAPCRKPQVGTRAFSLSDDGANLAAAVQTIFEIGDADGLDAAIDDAFPRSRIEVAEHDGYFDLMLKQDGLLRPLRAVELSDGTLRFLMLAAALLSPRPPSLLVLNEPETSLHSELLRPLATLIARAAQASQIIVVTHASALVDALCASGAHSIALRKEHGETLTDAPVRLPFEWPPRSGR